MARERDVLVRPADSVAAHRVRLAKAAVRHHHHHHSTHRHDDDVTQDAAAKPRKTRKHHHHHHHHHKHHHKHKDRSKQPGVGETLTAVDLNTSEERYVKMLEEERLRSLKEAKALRKEARREARRKEFEDGSDDEVEDRRDRQRTRDERKARRNSEWGVDDEPDDQSWPRSRLREERRVERLGEKGERKDKGRRRARDESEESDSSWSSDRGRRYESERRRDRDKGRDSGRGSRGDDRRRKGDRNDRSRSRGYEKGYERRRRDRESDEDLRDDDSESRSSGRRYSRPGRVRDEEDVRSRSQSRSRTVQAAGFVEGVREFAEGVRGIADAVGVDADVFVREAEAAALGEYPDGTFVPGTGGGSTGPRVNGYRSMEPTRVSGLNEPAFSPGLGPEVDESLRLGPRPEPLGAAAVLAYGGGLGRGSDYGDEMDTADRYAAWVREQARRSHYRPRRHHRRRRHHRGSRRRRHRRRRSEETLSEEGEGTMEATEDGPPEGDQSTVGGVPAGGYPQASSSKTNVENDDESDPDGKEESGEDDGVGGSLRRLAGKVSKGGLLKAGLAAAGVAGAAYVANKVISKKQDKKRAQQAVDGGATNASSTEYVGSEDEDDDDEEVFNERRFHPPIPEGSMFSVKVPQNQACVVERGGKYHRKLTAGTNRIVPCVERITDCHSLKEMMMPIPYQQCYTADNISVRANGVVVFRVEDPVAASYDVDNPYRSLVALAQTCIRNEIGLLPLQKVSNSRIALSNRILEQMEEVTRSWGVRCIRFDLRDLQLPEDLREQLDREAEAERQKRAHVLQSEAERDAAINRAEGYYQTQMKLSQARQVEKVNNAIAEAHAIAERGEAIAHAMRDVADAVNEPGGEKAMQMRIAEQYINAYGKATNGPGVPPPDPNHVASSMNDAIGLLGTLDNGVQPVPMAAFPQNPFEGPPTAPGVVPPPIFADLPPPVMSVPSTSRPSPGRHQGAPSSAVLSEQPNPLQTPQSMYSQQQPPSYGLPPSSAYAHAPPSAYSHVPPPQSGQLLPSQSGQPPQPWSGHPPHAQYGEASPPVNNQQHLTQPPQDVPPPPMDYPQP